MRIVTRDPDNNAKRHARPPEPECGDCGSYMRMSGRGVCSLRPCGDDTCRPADYAGDCRWFMRSGDHSDPWLDEPERAAFGRLTDYIEGRASEIPDIRPLDADYVAGYLMELCRQQHAKLNPPTIKGCDLMRCTCGKQIPAEAGCWDADDVFVCIECYERQESAR